MTRSLIQFLGVRSSFLVALVTLGAACVEPGGASGGGSAGDATGGITTLQSGSGGAATSSGGSAAAVGGVPDSASGGVVITGGAPGAGGVEQSTGGMEQSTGGVEQSTGGMEQSTGGVEQSTGGTEQSTGGVEQLTGGVEQSTGGVEQSTGGVEQATGGSTAEEVVIGAERYGEATYYNGSGVVNCSFEGITDSMNIAALNNPDYDMAAWCGACARVSGPNGEVKVRIVDRCPECASGDLDLSPSAFDQIAERSAGRVEISWTFVSCDVTGPVTYRMKDGVNQGWTALIVENHRLPVASMEYSKDEVSWTTMERQEYNFFLEASGFGPGVTFVRITATDGQQLVDRIPRVQEYAVTEGEANFQ